MPPCGFAGESDESGRLFGQRRGYAGPVEPVRLFEDCVEIEIIGGSLRESRVFPVVDHLPGPHSRTGFLVVDSDPFTTAGYEGSVHSVPAQGVHCGLPHLVGREFGYEAGVMAIIGQAHRHVRLAAAEFHVEDGRLDKPRMTRRGKPEHKFPHCDDFHTG